MESVMNQENSFYYKYSAEENKEHIRTIFTDDIILCIESVMESTDKLTKQTGKQTNRSFLTLM